MSDLNPKQVMHQGAGCETKLNSRVAMTTSGLLLMLFVAVSRGVGYATNKKKAEQEATQGESSPNPFSINRDVSLWMSIATCFCNMNYAVILPGVVQENAGVHVESGVLIGVYAIGTVVTYP